MYGEAPQTKQVTLTLPETKKERTPEKMHGWNKSYFPGRCYILLSGSVGTFFPLQTVVIPAFKAAPSAGIGLGGYASSSLGRTIP